MQKMSLKWALIEYKGSILMVCHEPEFYGGLADDVWDWQQSGPTKNYFSYM